MNTNYSHLLPRVLAAGLAGAVLRLILYRVGFDEKGLLAAGHPLHLLSMVLAVAAVIALALQCRKIPEPQANLTLPGIAAGLAAGSLMLLHTCLLAQTEAAPLALIRLAVSALGTASMLLTLCPPIRKSPILPFCLGVVCVHFALDMLCRYRQWSGNPQLPDYCFHVLACVFLCLCSYQRLAFGVGQGSRKALSFCCLTGLLLCMLSLAGPEAPGYYLGGACWSLCCLCVQLPPRDSESPEETDEAIPPEQEAL